MDAVPTVESNGLFFSGSSKINFCCYILCQIIDTKVGSPLQDDSRPLRSALGSCITPSGPLYIIPYLASLVGTMWSVKKHWSILLLAQEISIEATVYLQQQSVFALHKHSSIPDRTPLTWVYSQWQVAICHVLNNKRISNIQTFK